MQRGVNSVLVLQKPNGAATRTAKGNIVCRVSGPSVERRVPGGNSARRTPSGERHPRNVDAVGPALGAWPCSQTAASGEPWYLGMASSVSCRLKTCTAVFMSSKCRKLGASGFTFSQPTPAVRLFYRGRVACTLPQQWFRWAGIQLQASSKAFTGDCYGCQDH